MPETLIDDLAELTGDELHELITILANGGNSISAVMALGAIDGDPIVSYALLLQEQIETLRQTSMQIARIRVPIGEAARIVTRSQIQRHQQIKP